MRVPEEVRGGYYAILFLESLLGEAPDINEGVVVPVAVRIGALFYVEAKGTIDRNARLKNIKLTKEFKDRALKVSADFVNTGNVDITASGTFYIIDDEGLVYGRGRFNQVYTFPDDAAKLYADCKEPIPPGTYDLVITLEISEGLSLIEEIEMVVGSSGEILTFQVSY